MSHQSCDRSLRDHEHAPCPGMNSAGHGLIASDLQIRICCPVPKKRKQTRSAIAQGVSSASVEIPWEASRQASRSRPPSAPAAEAMKAPISMEKKRKNDVDADALRAASAPCLTFSSTALICVITSSIRFSASC